MGLNIRPDPQNSYSLQLDFLGGLTSSSSTPIQMDTLSLLTFIQTDKKIYKPGQLGMVSGLTLSPSISRLLLFCVSVSLSV